MHSLTCPRCRKLLIRSQGKLGVFYECENCKGRAVSLAVLRKVIDPGMLSQVWNRVCSGEAGEGVNCSACSRKTREVTFTRDGQPALTLDVCRFCAFWWFDPREIEGLPAKKLPPPAPELSPAGKEAVAIARVQLERQRDESMGVSQEGPQELWQWFPAILLGVPVEHDDIGRARWPWITWITVAACCLVFAAGLYLNEEWVRDFGLIPDQWDRLGGLTILTSFFLHAGWLHLISNMMFLYMFGDNVEDELGHWRYLLLLVGGIVAGGVAHILVETRSSIPSVGASDGISSVLVYYALRFPRHRLLFHTPWLIWLYVPAWAALVAWVGLQFWLVTQQMYGIGNVSAAAHLGGAAVGVIAWWLARPRVKANAAGLLSSLPTRAPVQPPAN